MLRKVVIVVVLLAVIAAAAFWFITMPATVSADALGPYSPDLDNGKTMFHAGCCAACHATPNQQDKTKLGGGLGHREVPAHGVAHQDRRDARDRRQEEFIDNLCRKLLAYALGRSLLLSDEETVREMRARLAANGYRFGTLVESVVTSPQFLNRRVDGKPERGNQP